jgi:hypothetical protein
MAEGIAAFFEELGASIREGWQRAERSAEQRRLWNAVTIRAFGWDRELAELRRRYEALKADHDASPFADPELPNRLVVACLREVLEELDGHAPPDAVLQAMVSATVDLLEQEPFFSFPHIDWQVPLSLDEGIALRQYLDRKSHFLARPMDAVQLWSRHLVSAWAGMLRYLPSNVTAAPTDPGSSALSASLTDLLRNPSEVIERLVIHIFADDVSRADLFAEVRSRVEGNVCAVSGIPIEDRATSNRPLVLPTNSNLRGAALVDAYLDGTPFADFFAADVPFSIPEQTRFEHCHIIGGTGHGKTQLLQHLILQDLDKVAAGEASVIVIDSQGDLIRTISRLDLFDPAAASGLADRLVVIDPHDIAFPAALNLFDTDRPRYANYSPVEREKLLNGTIELYEYMFGALLGAELTQKQGVIFRYLARLLLAIPDATIQTLRELMEDGARFRPYMETLPGSARHFFETEFFHPSFRATKQQILKRLWGVLSNPTFERMFSHPRNKVDLFELMNRGSVVLISTAKDLLKQEGSSIFGRFFIAQIAQAATERAVLPSDQRTPTFVYIDEAADYLDHHVEHLVNQARKYRVGLTIAHQNLDQLDPAIRAAVMASTTIKFAGGVSAKDARLLSDDMRCDPEFLQAMSKHRNRTEFATWIKNLTPRAFRVTVPLGSVEALPTLDDAVYEELLDANHGRYCVPAVEVDAHLERMRRPPAPERRVDQPAPQQHPLQVYEQAPPAPSPPPPPPRPFAPQEVEAHPKPPLPPAHTRPVAEQVELPPSPATPPPPQRRREPHLLPAPLGQGGREHAYLQHLVKEAAQQSGWHATIEQSVPDAAGRVDVSLQRDGIRVACEISVTTSVDHEMANAEKCLNAGYDRVYLVSTNEPRLAALRKAAAEHFAKRDLDRLAFFRPEELVIHLKELPHAPSPTETISRGYKVKLSHGRPDPLKGKERRQALAGLIARSVKRRGGPEPSPQ